METKNKTSWSFSSLMDYERCPHTQSFPYTKGPKQINEAAQRGIDAHKKCADYILHGGDAPPFIGFNWNSLVNARVEEKIGLDEDWQPTAYKTAWLKIIPDALVVAPEGITIIDHKTGKREYKEIKHSQQMQLYACAINAIYTDIHAITSELWYLDHGFKHTATYTPKKLEGMRMRFTNRALTMLQDTEMRPKPNKSNCKFCQHNPDQGGRCEYAFQP